MNTAYSEWFAGDHKGIAPPDTHRPGDPGPGCFNNPSSFIGEIRQVREAVLHLMDPDSWITRDDQFAVFMQLADDLGEAIDEMLAIGRPAERKDGTVVWESDDSWPIATAEAIAEERVMAELKTPAGVLF